MYATFQEWWMSVGGSLGFSDLDPENLITLEHTAEKAWNASHTNSHEEIKRLQDNVDLLEQTLEEEMNGDFELAMG